jgi:hypothetical protein
LRNLRPDAEYEEKTFCYIASYFALSFLFIPRCDLFTKWRRKEIAYHYYYALAEGGERDDPAWKGWSSLRMCNLQFHLFKYQKNLRSQEQIQFRCSTSMQLFPVLLFSSFNGKELLPSVVLQSMQIFHFSKVHPRRKGCEVYLRKQVVFNSHDNNEKWN